MATTIKNSLTQNGHVYHGDLFSGTIVADDPEGQLVTYHIVSGDLPIGISFDALAGAFTGTASLRNIDTGKLYPNDYTWEFIVSASDGVNTPVEKQWGITVKHHNSPPITSATSSTFTMTGAESSMFSQNMISALNISVPESNASVYDQTGYSPPALTITTTGLPVFLSLANGVISGTLPVVDANGVSYNFTLTASNIYGSTNVVCTLNVVNANNAPVWTTNNDLGSFQENDSISLLLQATDADAEALTYSHLSGTLPAGVIVTGNHVSGTAPTLLASTTYAFVMSVTDGITPVTRTFSITIEGTNLPVVWNTSAGSLGNVTVDQSFTYQLDATDPESQSVTYSVTGGALPSGLSVSGSGYISGTANTVGNASFIVGASDGINVTNRSFNISVTQNLGPSWTTPAGSLGGADQGTSFSYQLEATDPENDSLTYSVTSGSLPDGLTMGSDGLISGTMPSNPLPAHTVVAYAPSQTTGNLVYDGALTLSGSRWNLSGWHVLNVGPNYFLYLSNSSGSGPVNSGSGYVTASAYSDKFVVSANTDYTFQVSIYMTQIQSTGTFYIDIEWFDSASSSIGASDPDAMTVNDSQYYEENTSAGPHYSFTGLRWRTVVSPANAVYGRMRLYTTGFHYVYPYLDIHYNNFEVCQSSTFVGFSDDATEGAPYNTPTPIYNYDINDTSQFDITTTFEVTVTDGTTSVPRTFSINNIAT